MEMFAIYDTVLSIWQDYHSSLEKSNASVLQKTRELTLMVDQYTTIKNESRLNVKLKVKVFIDFL